MTAPASPEMSARKAELLDAAVDYIHEHGLADLSLRPLAAAIGTSARLLVYHFGSKEQLIADALEGVRARQEALVDEWLRSAQGQPFPEIMTRFWGASSSPGSLAYGRLFFEAYGMALIDGDRLPGFLDGAVHRWLEVISAALTAEGASAERAEVIATSVLAAHRGLLLDLLATGDRDRVDAAHRVLTRSLAAVVDSAIDPGGDAL